jgi:hypothetical protein
MFRTANTTAARLASRHFPKGAQEIKAPGIEAVVYQSEMAGRFYAIGYRGTAGRPSFNYSFRTAEARAEHVLRFFASVGGMTKYSEERKAELAAKRAAGHGVQVGAVFYTSWGYDQTNVSFYEVIETTRGTITVRPLRQETKDTGHMSGTCVAIPGAFAGEKSLRCIWSGRGFKIDGHHASAWDGQPKHFSSYA